MNLGLRLGKRHDAAIITMRQTARAARGMATFNRSGGSDAGMNLRWTS